MTTESQRGRLCVDLPPDEVWFVSEFPIRVGPRMHYDRKVGSYRLKVGLTGGRIVFECSVYRVVFIITCSLQFRFNFRNSCIKWGIQNVWDVESIHPTPLHQNLRRNGDNSELHFPAVVFLVCCTYYAFYFCRGCDGYMRIRYGFGWRVSGSKDFIKMKLKTDFEIAAAFSEIMITYESLIASWICTSQERLRLSVYSTFWTDPILPRKQFTYISSVLWFTSSAALEISTLIGRNRKIYLQHHGF